MQHLTDLFNVALPVDKANGHREERTCPERDNLFILTRKATPDIKGRRDRMSSFCSLLVRDCSATKPNRSRKNVTMMMSHRSDMQSLQFSVPQC